MRCLLCALVILSGFIALCNMTAQVDAAAVQAAPKVTIPITIPPDAKLQRPVVFFPHDKHAAEECALCHHVLNEGKLVYTCATPGCHDLANPKGEDKKSIKYFRNAFHVRKEASCNGCHALRKKAGEPHGPTACKACHKK